MTFNRGDRTYELSDERMQMLAALTPAERMAWVEQCSQFLRLARLRPPTPFTAPSLPHPPQESPP